MYQHLNLKKYSNQLQTGRVNALSVFFLFSKGYLIQPSAKINMHTTTHNTNQDEQEIAQLTELETVRSNSEIPSWMSDIYG